MQGPSGHTSYSALWPPRPSGATKAFTFTATQIKNWSCRPAQVRRTGLAELPPTEVLPGPSSSLVSSPKKRAPTGDSDLKDPITTWIRKSKSPSPGDQGTSVPLSMLRAYDTLSIDRPPWRNGPSTCRAFPEGKNRPRRCPSFAANWVALALVSTSEPHTLWTRSNPSPAAWGDIPQT